MSPSPNSNFTYIKQSSMFLLRFYRIWGGLFATDLVAIQHGSCAVIVSWFPMVTVDILNSNSYIDIFVDIWRAFIY